MAGKMLRHAGVLVVTLLCVFTGAATAGDLQGTTRRTRRQIWLESSFKKVRQDSARINETVATLQEELRNDSGDDMPEGVQERVEALAGKGVKLQEAVKDADMNLLSFEVVSLAAEIEDEGKALRELFKVLQPRRRRNRFRNLANEIRKKADSVKDRMRIP
jgi:uncharacterized protein YlxW (UPF0749 family)